MQTSKARYSARTILKTHRRVLRMVFGYLSNMDGVDLQTLRTDGKGLMTFGEVLAHVGAALNLKEKRRAD